MGYETEQCYVTYPGIQQYESFEWTDSCGVNPSQGLMTVFPQYGIPPIEGDIVMTQGSCSVTLKKCRIDQVYYEAGSSGQIASVRFFDERWRWLKGYHITGKYNTRLPNMDINPAREKTPAELVKLLCDAMGVANIVFTLLTSDTAIAATRPEVDWDVSNPAQELQQLLDTWGLKLVPNRSNGTFVVCRNGVGAALSANGLPYADAGQGIDPDEAPDAVEVFGEPILWQVRLELEAVGQDIIDPATTGADGKWKPINELSYTPNIAFARTWEHESDEFENISRDRIQQPDGSYHSPQDFARKTVFRCYRVKTDGAGFIEIPGYTDPVDGTNHVIRKQIILTDQLVERYIDTDNAKQMKPAFCDFYGTHRLWQGEGNSLPGTRLDVQSKDPEDPNEVVTFSIQTHLERQIVTFSTQLRRYPDGSDDEASLPAKVYLTCAIQIRHPTTWQPIRYSKKKSLPNAPAESKFILPMRQDEIRYRLQQTYLITQSGPNAGAGNPSLLIDNKPICDAQADYYLDSKIASLQLKDAKTLSILCLSPQVMDGAISQISYAVSLAGVTTKISRNTEHETRIPSYRDQLQRNLRTATARRSDEQQIRDLKRKLEQL